MGETLVELCAGTAAVSLRALGGPSAPAPLVGYMGGKRRWATQLCEVLGVADRRPERVVLVDAGPWGFAWSVLSTPRGRVDVAGHLEGWANEDPVTLWEWLATDAPFGDPSAQVAQYLWLQARSASCIPVWWSEEAGRWEAPTGSKTQQAHQRGGRRATMTANGGIVDPGTVARRVRALDALDWDSVTVIHGDVRDVAPILGASVLFDPPYHMAPRYAALLPRVDVVDVAHHWRAAGAHVVICEAEPLEMYAWHSQQLPGRKPEWITSSRPLAAQPEQLELGAW